MKVRPRTIGKWILRVFAFLLLIEVLHIGTVAYPFPFFSHKGSFGEFTVYSRSPLPGGFEQIIEGVRLRVAAMENARPGHRIRIYLCDTQRFYSFFALLIRKEPDSLGIGLSVFSNMYLNEAKIRRVAAGNTAGIRHTRFEGNYAGLIAHEIAHFNVVEELGYRAAMRMPFWKGEGYAEQQANFAAIRSDPEYNFLDRIALFENHRFWAGNRSARDLFESHLLVEYLMEREGYGLRDLIDESVTLDATRARMLAWYRKQRPAS